MLELINSGQKLTEGELAEVERTLGIDLPPDYRAFLLNQNGGEPVPPLAFPFRYRDGEKGQATVTRFVPVGDMDRSLAAYLGNLRRAGLSDRLVMVAEVDHDDILFLYVAGEDRGKVCYWYMVDGEFEGDYLLPVADSFDGFLGLLTPSEE